MKTKTLRVVPFLPFDKNKSVKDGTVKRLSHLSVGRRTVTLCGQWFAGDITMRADYSTWADVDTRCETCLALESDTTALERLNTIIERKAENAK